jgi:hypothetical protein
MLTAAELQSTSAALDAAKAEVDRIESEVGFLSRAQGILAVLSEGITPSSSADDAAVSARVLYDALRDLQRKAIESPDAEHEIALQILEMTGRLQARDIPASVKELEAMNLPTIVATSISRTISQTKTIAIVVVVVAGGLLAYLLARNVRTLAT